MDSLNSATIIHATNTVSPEASIAAASFIDSMEDMFTKVGVLV